MSASGWDYLCDHDPDLGAALERLRRKVFADGDYFPLTMNPEYAAATGRAPAEHAPATIDALLAMQGREGTHSILDICHGVSATPRGGAVSTLTEAQRVEQFGTATPSCEQVTAWMRDGGFHRLLPRTSAVVVACTRDGAPLHLHFGGRSGR
ncbi:MAG: hypothetical protein R3A48_07690 [Polyangiales bacterium]